MKPDQIAFQRRVLDTVELLLDTPPPERASRIAALDDDALRAEVQAVLAEEERGELKRLNGLPRVVEIAEGDDGFEPGSRVGSFELVRAIGSGGMGRVYEALQEKPRRRVALKMLRVELDSGSTRRRFEYEAEALASLRHPAIAQIYEAGVHREQAATGEREVPYIALEFVEDARSITRWAREERPDRETLLRLFIQVCEAVHHGHGRGVIHRDLKPGNVLVDAEGRPKVIDFGIARATGRSDLVGGAETRTGELVGTLQYMAPEQVQGGSQDLDMRCDVYALGALLHQLLGGRPPHDVEGIPIPEAARLVVEKEPTPLRRLVPDLPVDLGTIVGKALAKEREARYASAAALGADLERFLRREPIEAHPPSRTYLLRLFVRRNRLLVGSAAAVFLTAIVGGVISVTFASDAKVALEHADELEASLLDFGEEVVLDYLYELDRLGVPIETRAELVEATLERLDQLRESAGDDPDVLLSVAATHLRLAEILGGTTRSNLGDLAGAERSARTALELAEGLLADGAENERALRIIAQAELALGELVEARGDLDQTRERYTRAVAIYESLGAEKAADPMLRAEMAKALYYMGSSHGLGREGMLSMLDRSGAIYEGLVAELPNELGFRRVLASLRQTRGGIHVVFGDAEAGRVDLERAVELIEDVARADPRNTVHQVELLHARRELAAYVLRAGGDPDLALAHLDRADEELEPLLKGDHKDARLRTHAIQILVQRGAALLARANAARERGEPWEDDLYAALEAWDACEESLAKLPKEDARIWMDQVRMRITQDREETWKLLDYGE